MAQAEKPYSWMFSTGRLSRGRTIIDSCRDDEVMVKQQTKTPGWAEPPHRSRALAALSGFSVDIKSSPQVPDDIPWSPGLVLVSQKVRELLAFCEDQVVWAPVRIGNHCFPAGVRVEYHLMLATTFLKCAVPESDMPPERRKWFAFDAAKVPEGTEVFVLMDKPYMTMVSQRVKDVLTRAKIKRPYFASPNDGPAD